MDNALVMRGLKGVGHLTCDGQHIGHWHRPACDVRGEILTLHEFHHDGANILCFLEAVNVRDVRMVERGQGLGLAREPREAFRVVGKNARHDLDGNVSIELRVPGAIHLAHPASTDDTEDFVRAEALPGEQRHAENALSSKFVSAHASLTSCAAGRRVEEPFLVPWFSAKSGVQSHKSGRNLDWLWERTRSKAGGK